MRVYNGYLERDGHLILTILKRRTYVIEQWDGIDKPGITKIITAKIFKTASDDRAVENLRVSKITLDMTTSNKHR